MPSDATFATLPRRLPIFPLTGALLLPGGHLPLQIFEPRYLQMTRDALTGQRLIGMIQPREHEKTTQRPTLYDVGCVGRIDTAEDSTDGRILITLTGLCRFQVVEELSVSTLYRQIIAAFTRYRADLEPRSKPEVDRSRLIDGLRQFLKVESSAPEWQWLTTVPADQLVNSLAMLCPFAPNEKQALLEAENIAARASLMLSLIDMALMERRSNDPGRGLRN